MSTTEELQARIVELERKLQEAIDSDRESLGMYNRARDRAELLGHELEKERALVQKLGKVIGWYRWHVGRIEPLLRMFRWFRRGSIDQAQLISGFNAPELDPLDKLEPLVPHLMEDEVQKAIVPFEATRS